MMRYRLCPYCDDEPLSIVYDKRFIRVICRECGWAYTFMPPPSSEDELGERIDAMIAEAKHGRADEN